MVTKKLYVYKSLDVCDPTDESPYHRDGGLVVITGGRVGDAVPDGTGNGVEIDGETFSVLPVPDLVVEVSDYLDDIVIPFPNAGCC
jgi:hypothetical protein